MSQLNQPLNAQEISEILRECDRCSKERLLDIATLKDQKIKIEALGVRLTQADAASEILNTTILNWKIAYTNLEDSYKKKTFWIWLKGVVVGVGVGALTVVLLLI